ncbi:hypothetical protein G3T36_11505 [Diaminobutyricibacter tongyongensis]|uniref:DUF3558 domain-containing protein n=1 Tax=Leifsonia tongyongensis TaxID=1268043 RepID=A0A6L9XZ05_9MICO|nr:hypothetical protein [Diaminobutyricibacter tongyongensis]NEN06495.1 hypothetical protein [Diaminobutyricibacter tongyongensis]
MSRRGGTIVALGALSAALLLSGCTSSPPPAHTADPVASTAPTPAAVHPTCATMAPPSTLAAIAPQLVVQPATNYSIAPPAENAAPSARAVFMTAVYPPSATTVLAGLQAGYFDCEWRDTPSTNYVRVSVLPAGSAAFDAHWRSTHYDIASWALFAGLGKADKSVGGCMNGDGPSCEISTLSGTTWVTVTESEGDISATTAPAIRAHLEAITHSTLAALDAAGPLVAAQQQPPSRWQSGGCTVVDTAVQSITGSTGGTAEKRALDFTDAYDPVFRAAVAQSGAFDCVDTEAQVTIVPGADDTAPIVYTSDSTTPVAVSIPGVAGARDLCDASNATACWTEGYIDHALVTIAGDLTASGRHAELAAIAVALAG